MTKRMRGIGSPGSLLVALVLAGCGGATRQGDMTGATRPSNDASSDADAPSDLGGAQDLGPSPDLATSPDAATAVNSDDGFGEARAACIAEINRLRATQALPPYVLVDTDDIDTCVDAQATSDEKSGNAHEAWKAAKGSVCDGNGQDECEGYGTDAAGIVACLDDMWAEKDQSNCTGCVGCTDFGGACANCDFSGEHGMECGHYVNMSATYFSGVSCGFSTKTWAAQNFYISN